MPITLAEARSLIHRFTSPNGTMDSSVLECVNWIQQRCLNSGNWRGDKSQIVFNTPEDYVTLPRRFESLLGVRFDKQPRLVYSQYHTFMEGGPGELGEDCFTMSALVDLGPGFASFLNISAEATLRVKIENVADAAKTIWLKGEDADGRVIYNSSGVEGISVTTANPSVTTTQTFTKLVGLQKPITVGYVTLWQVISGVETKIGTYEPGETVADYRRYQLGQTSGPDAITGLAKRKYIPAIAETDLIYPDNIAALEFAAMSWNFFRESDMDRSNQFWTSALNELNLQSRQTRGGNQMRMNTSIHGLKLHAIRRMM